MNTWTPKLFLIVFWKILLLSCTHFAFASEPRHRLIVSTETRLESGLESARQSLIVLLDEPDPVLFHKKVVAIYKLFQNQFESIVNESSEESRARLKPFPYYWSQVLLNTTDYDFGSLEETGILLEALKSDSKVSYRNLKFFVRWGLLGPFHDPLGGIQAPFLRFQPYLNRACRTDEKRCYLLLDTFFNLDSGSVENPDYPQDWQAIHAALQKEAQASFRQRFREALDHGHYHVTELLLSLLRTYGIPLFEPDEFVYTHCPYLEMVLEKMHKISSSESVESWLRDNFPKDRSFSSDLLKRFTKHTQHFDDLELTKPVHQYLLAGLIRNQVLRYISTEFQILFDEDPKAHVKLREFLSYTNTTTGIYGQANVRHGLRELILYPAPKKVLLHSHVRIDADRTETMGTVPNETARGPLGGVNAPHHLIYKSSVTQNLQALELLTHALQYRLPKSENPLSLLLTPYVPGSGQQNLGTQEALRLKEVFRFYFFSEKFPKATVLRWLEDAPEGGVSVLGGIFDLNFFELLPSLVDFYDLAGVFKPAFHNPLALNMARFEMIKRRLAKEDSPALKLELEDLKRQIEIKR